MKKLVYCSLSLLSLASTLTLAEDQTSSGSLTIKANVLKSCMVNTNNAGQLNNSVIDFGTITSLTENIDASTSESNNNKIGVLCSNTTPWTLSLDGGKNSLQNQRRMSGGSEKTEYIPYNLYLDASRTSEIQFNTVAISNTGTGTQQLFDIYGRIPAGSTLPAPGNYIDTVTISVTY